MAKFINGQTAKEQIESGDITVIDFFATWCGPCQMYIPVFDGVALRYDGTIEMAKVDIDADIDFASDYNITGVPTTIIFKDGKEVERFAGFKDAVGLIELIEKVIKQGQ